MPVSRRHFLQRSTGLAASAFAAPYIVPSTAFGANDRITVACVGVRNQGSGNLKRFLAAGAQVAAVCDVDADVAAKARKTVEEKGGSCGVEQDYRRLLDRSDIDAIVNSTPDHWHALITIDACHAGKDVYCEKPLSLTIAEGRRMVQAARDNQRIVQTGSQQRSSDNFRRACELVRNGAIGDVKQVFAGIANPNFPGKLGPCTAPPAELDYNMWLGPAPRVPYNEDRVHYNFRFWWDYSGGQMTNWGAHHIDIAQWGLGMDDSGPVKSDGWATFHPLGYHQVTESCRITHTYENGITLTVGQRQDDIRMGTRFVGSDGTLFVDRGKLTSDPGDILKTELPADSERLYVSKDHTQNFLDCVKSRELPICDVEIGHRSATICHLGNIVARLGRGIQWDPQSERIIDDADAQVMTDRHYREPWKKQGVAVASA